MKIGKKLLSWDESQVIEDEVQHVLDCKDDEFLLTLHEGEGELTEAEAREYVYNDAELVESAWDDMKEALTEILRKKNKTIYWKAFVKNFGWRAISGYQYFYAETGEEFLDKILPDTECTFHIYNYGKGLAIQNFHHDSPTGNEWYYITPITDTTYYRFH